MTQGSKAIDLTPGQMCLTEMNIAIPLIAVSLRCSLVDLDDEKVKTHIDRGQQPSRLLPIQKRYNSFDLEDLMNDRMFENPVFVKDGNNLIQEIACLEDAVEFLYEWPRNRRGPIYDTALRACQKAFDSDYPLSAARQAFAGFAKSARILEEISTPLPWMTANTGRSGGLAT